MTSLARAISIAIAGALAFGAGYFASQLNKDDAPESKRVSATGLERPLQRQGAKVDDVNPDLLMELRKLSRYSNSNDRLGAEDFPGVLLRAHDDDDSEATIALIRQWAKVDGDGMVEFFLRQGHLSLRLDSHSWRSFKDLLLGLLVDEDPQRAWETVLRFPNQQGYRRDVLGVIAEKSPDMAVELALQNLDKLNYGAYFDLGKVGNRKLALALAKRVPFGKVELDALKDVYFADDLKSQLEIWNSLDDETQARTAAAFLPQHDDGGVAAEKFYGLLAERIESGAEQDAQVVNRFLEIFSKRLIEAEGIAGAVDWVEKNAGSMTGWNALYKVFDRAKTAGVPREEILAEFDASQHPAKQGLVGGMIRLLFADDPAAAAGWVAGMPSGQSALSGALELGNLMANKPDAEMGAALLELPVGSHSDTFLVGVATQRFNHLGGEKSMEWANALPEDRSRAAQEQVMRNWIDRQPERAIEYFDELPQDAAHRDALVRAVSWRQLHIPDEARGEWISGLSAGDRAQVREVVQLSGQTAEWRAQKLAELGGD